MVSGGAEKAMRGPFFSDLWSLKQQVPETRASASANAGRSSLWVFCFVISPKELLLSTPAEKNLA